MPTANWKHREGHSIVQLDNPQSAKDAESLMGLASMQHSSELKGLQHTNRIVAHDTGWSHYGDDIRTTVLRVTNTLGAVEAESNRIQKALQFYLGHDHRCCQLSLLCG